MNESSPIPDITPGPSLFERRLTIVTMTAILFTLTFHMLRELASVLQPLFIAALITYMSVPARRRLVRLGVPAPLAHFVLIGLVLLFFFLVARLAQSNVEDLLNNRQGYEERLDTLLVNVSQSFRLSELEGKRVKDFVPEPTVEQVIAQMRLLAGGFASYLAVLFVVVLYVVFLGAEIHSFPERAEKAFGSERAGQVMGIVDSINRAVGGYLGVMTLINALIGLFTFVVLVAFDVPFAPLWALLMFLFSYIPYLGSIVVTLAVLVMGLVRYADQPWVVLVIAALLVAIQQFLGAYLQPKLMGTRLGVSPLLILLSLGYWGVVWGIIGMLLAVPLLMVLKITLDNIPETKPVAKLMSHP